MCELLFKVVTGLILLAQADAVSSRIVQEVLGREEILIPPPPGPEPIEVVQLPLPPAIKDGK